MRSPLALGTCLPVTDQAVLAPPAEDEGKLATTPNTDAQAAGVAGSADAAAAFGGEAGPRAAPRPAAMAPDPGPEPPVVRPRGGGRGLAITCSLVALIAALVALTAPTLRPAIAELADSWFGRNNAVSWLIAPAADTTWRTAREEAMLAVSSRLADYTARIDRLAATQEATAADVSRAIAGLNAQRAMGETLSRTVDNLTSQTSELRSQTTMLGARTRASGLLALSLRLRRDVDAGLPIGRDYAALMAAGPYPEQVSRVLQQLRKLSDGVPTMRDLADTFDTMMARFAARSDAATSWTSRSWSRVTELFGGGSPNSNTRLFEHLRALAADGRFSEAADTIEASNFADLGRDWVAQVRARAIAVIATQAILGYALTAYDDAYAASAQAAGPEGKPTQ